MADPQLIDLPWLSPPPVDFFQQVRALATSMPDVSPIRRRPADASEMTSMEQSAD